MSKTVTEVSRLTGLSVKVIDDYDKEGIVKASHRRTLGYEDRNGKKYRGYKEYDDTAVLKLCQAAIYKKIGVPRAEIKKKLTASDYSCSRICDDQIILLEKKKQEIEGQIEMANQLRLIGLKGDMAQYLTILEPAKVAKWTKWVESSSYCKKICASFSEKEFEIFGELEEVLEKLFRIPWDDRSESESMVIAEDLINQVKNIYGFPGLFFVLVFALCGIGQGELYQELNELFGQDIETPSTVILEYLDTWFDRFFNDFIEILKNNYKAFKEYFDGPETLALVSDMKDLLAEYFCITQAEEYEFLFELFNIKPYSGGEDYINYAMNALKLECA